MNRYKIAVVMICLNEPYWQYLKPCIDSLKKFMLKRHELDFLVWTDMPKEREKDLGATIIPTEPFQWPLPTLHRYHLFLREEEKLREYDYVFYCDADMLAVSRIGDEILGDLVGAQHPMHAYKDSYNPPYEPNEKSTAFIPRPGRIVVRNGKRKLEPLYYAGGFQGGRSDLWIDAMKVMRDRIDEDFSKNNYIARWNDESHVNRYFFENPPDVVLNPSYVYPDSLIGEYYKPLWGRNYVPKLVTLTKKFTLSREGGQAIKQLLS